MQRILSWVYFLLGLAGNIRFALYTGIALLVSVFSAAYALVQQTPLPLVALLFIAVFLIVVGLVNYAVNWRVARQNQPTQLDAQEPWRGQDALDAYLKQMQQWLDDENRPLLELPPEAPRRKSARIQTREVLRRLDPDGKRSVLQFLQEQGLIKHDETTISMYEADLSEASLSGVSVTDAKLDYAILRNADLSDATLCGDSQVNIAGLEASTQKGGDYFDYTRPMRTSSFLMPSSMARSWRVPRWCAAK